MLYNFDCCLFNLKVNISIQPEILSFKIIFDIYVATRNIKI